MPTKKTTTKPGSSSRPRIDPSDLSDEARNRLVVSDAARKRSSLRYIRAGVEVTASLRYRSFEEFDRLRAAAWRGEGSSTGAGSSRGAGSSSGALVQRQRQRREEALDGYDATAFEAAFAVEDFVPDNALDAVMATLCKRSAAEEKELAAKRRREEELDAVLLEQGIAAERAQRERAAEWEQDAVFVDLGSDDE